jgi:hypothetical protein
VYYISDFTNFVNVSIFNLQLLKNIQTAVSMYFILKKFSAKVKKNP